MRPMGAQRMMSSLRHRIFARDEISFVDSYAIYYCFDVKAS
jgi:hypothetical protein